MTELTLTIPLIPPNPELKELTIVIPLTPISVNHYKVQTRTGHWYVTKEATAFKDAVAIFARGASVVAKTYELTATVYLAHRQKGDGDNFWKCLADGLKDAGVIHSDAAVTDWIMRVRRDPAQPRTVITVRAIQ